MDELNIAIVGGGITGLTAAYYLQQKIQAENLPYHVKLFEASGRLGGKIRTLRRDGFIIERGADSFLCRKTAAVQLARELNIDDQLVRNDTGQAYILADHRLHKIPQGSFMGVPTRMVPFFFSNLFSLRGKLRASLDFLMPKGKSVDDQSLGKFLRRRLGRETVENIVEPLLSGVYSSDIDQMSLMATFPQFYKLEQTYGSIIKGLRQTMPKKRTRTGQASGQFFSFTNGLDTFVTTLANKLNSHTVQLHTAVDHIERKAHGYHLLLSNGEVYKAHAVIVASPHLTLPEIFSQFELFQVFKEIPVTSVANVALAFDEDAIRKPAHGTGFVVSRNSPYRITACTWTNEKWPHTTPKGKVLLRAYVGKPDDQDIVHLSDRDITSIVLNDLKNIITIKDDPLFTVVTRYIQQMPQYTVGHRERIEHVRKQMHKQLPGIFIAGSSYEGVGVPDCIAQGEEVVANVIEFLNNRRY